MSGEGAAHACANCGAILTGPYCARCGQEDRPLDEPFRRVAAQYLGGLFDWDARTLRTVRSLLFRPDLLTREYGLGRRARYRPPVRLFLIASFLLLVGVAFRGDRVQVSVGAPRSEDVLTPGRVLEGTPAAALGRRFDRGLENAQHGPGRLRERWFRSFAWSMFLAMPLFALLLALVERRSRRPYLHHLVFAVHVHAFAFFVLAALLIVPLEWAGRFGGAVVGILALTIPIYLVAALRSAYGRRLPRATAGALVLGAVHLPVVAALSFVATMLAILVAG